MKTVIKVRELTEGCLVEVNSKGDWIDLRAATDIHLEAAQAGVQYQLNNSKFRDVNIPVKLVPLGIAVQLPKGYEAIIAPRSSSPFRFNSFTPHSFGVIDNSYCGNNDEWKLLVSPLNTIDINKGDRVCQFRIQLSQKATTWQKIKWLFSNGIKVVKVNKLSNKNRGGFGSTGVN